MKKVRIIFSAAAIMLAVGTVLAAKLVSPVAGYEWRPVTSTCLQVTGVCDTQGTVACTYENAEGNIVTLRASNTPLTQCGTQLKKIE